MPIKIQNEPPENKYERVIVAAKEARRINEWDQQLLDRPYRRICEEAIARVEKGQVKFTYDPMPVAAPAPAPVAPTFSAPVDDGTGDDDDAADDVADVAEVVKVAKAAKAPKVADIAAVAAVAGDAAEE